MKLWWRLGSTLVLVISLFALQTGHTHAADVQDFTIRSFDVGYYLSRDEQKVSQLKVEETIVAEFPDYDQNHGILRVIPATYKDHPLHLKVQQVTDDLDGDRQYTTSKSNDNIVLKIGNADAYVHGVQTYRIVYMLDNVTTNFGDHDEFYWDVNGDQWQQTIEKVSARVHFSPEVAKALQPEARCFAGKLGEPSQDCSLTTEPDGGESIAFTTRAMAPGETLTFVFGFAKDTFAPYTVPPEEIARIASMIFFGAVLPPLVATAIVVRNWRKYGRDPKGKGTIVPQYLPPKEASVLASQIILKERFETRGVSAQMLDLAVRHYIKIYEHKQKKVFKDKITYELELVRDYGSLRTEEVEVIQMLFGTSAKAGDKVKLETLAQKLHTKAHKTGKDLSKRLVNQGYFRISPSKAILPYIVAGVLLLVAAAMCFVLGGWILGIGLVIAGVIVLVSSQAMPARTLKGVELRDYLLGLRDYMKLAEADRIKALQSPQGKLTEKIQIDLTDKSQLIKLYEKLLPYAMLFGIEEDWAKQLAQLYRESPEWYSGSSAFNSAVFASALHSFTVASGTTFTSPSSSSSSGFGGGGFSGGGGGGGGGGGW